MIEGQPSGTAYGAAVYRAVHQDLENGRIFKDPFAWSILGVNGRGMDELVASAPGRSALRTFVAFRHRFAEDALAAAHARGTQQAVILGAGLDTFAHRNAHSGLRVFEVDHPATGAWKQERVAAAYLDAGAATYVAVDLEREPLLPALAGAGFDVAAPAFFLWLGVVPYLTHEATRATLAAIASIPGAEVVFDYPAPAAAAAPAAGRAALAAHVAGLGEPLGEPWSPADLAEVLAGLGFSDVEDLGRAEIRAALGMPPGPAGGGAHVVRARRP